MRHSTETWLCAILILIPLCSGRGDPMPVAEPSVRSRSGPSFAADTLLVRSAILGQDRAAFVSLPPSHGNTTRTYPVIIVLDGEANFSDATLLATTLANLGHTPEAIVVGIPNPTADPQDRIHDLTPPGLSVSGSSLNEGGDRFLDFLERELLPAVSERYRGGAPRILIGHSSGAILATYAAATRPEAFPIVVAIDAPIHLGDQWLAKRLLERARSGGPEPLRYVSLEALYGWDDGRWAELEAAAPGSWLLRRETLDGESHESMGFLGMYQGLKFAFTDYSIAGAPIPPRGTAFGAFEHYHRIEAAFETELPPPARVLRRLIEDLLIEGRVEAARSALSWLRDGYGIQPDQADLESQIARVAALPPLAETVEDLKAAPMPSSSDIAAYVGEWSGHFWLTPEAKSEITLRIRDIGGSVSADVIHRFEDGTELVQPIEYMKVVPEGLEFGQMNGMRPMGMIVFEGHREGNVLAGEQRFRGIHIPLPNGDMPSVIHFQLVKRTSD